MTTNNQWVRNILSQRVEYNDISEVSDISEIARDLPT